MSANQDVRDKLIVALDVPSVGEAEAIVSELGDRVNFYKIGHQLGFAGGLSFASDLIREGKQVFLDMKLLDIDNTVAKGVESIAKMGVSMLTIHAYPKAMVAAVEAAKGSDLTLLGVTVLTSMDGPDLQAAGYRDHDPTKLVALRAQQASDAGMGGIVCSAQEAGLVRAIVGPDMAIVTPGIRPQGADHGDQKRVMTPSDALEAGASHLVIGRPIMAAKDKRQAALDISMEMTDVNQLPDQQHQLEEKIMPKAYWIARVDAHAGNEARYKDYIDAAKPAFDQYGAKFIARGGAIDEAEGACRKRNVIIEFESLDVAKACYYSDQYQKAAAIRQECADGEIVLVEGLE